MDQLPNSNKNFSSKSQQSNSSNQSQQHHYHHHHHHHSSSHHQQSSSNQNESKFYTLSTIEVKDQLENNLDEAFGKLQHLIVSQQQQSENSSALNELSQYASQSKAHYDEVLNALLYSMLTDPPSSARCLRNLFLCNNMSSFSHGSSNPNESSQQQSGSYTLLINNLLNIITENYSKLLDTPRQQLVWLLKELTKAKVSQFDKLLLQMLRNIQSGLVTDKNIWLAESMLEILQDHQAGIMDQNSNTSGLWLYSYNELMTQSVYTYLRLIADHCQVPTLTFLRQRETEFCCQVLRERWNECMSIGRDLVRILQNVSKINEFQQLWRDMMFSPQNLSPQFAQLGGLLYLMRLPTRRRCLISRLTVDMERKIYFIITSVKAGQQKRYLDWFQRQYLNTPESQSLRVDIIRYICVVVHPTNEQLNAGLAPRWALCSWLLTTCTSLIDSANLKLALYFDWILYDAKKDNIMLIEPAILLMYNSLKLSTNSASNSINLTSMLFDFLCRIATNYYWPFKDHILIGIMQSFKDSVDKRVIPSLQGFFQPIAENPANNNKQQQQPQPVLDRELRGLIQSTFGNFFQTLVINIQPTGQQSQQQPQLVKPIPSISNTQQLLNQSMTANQTSTEPISTSLPTTSVSSISIGSNQSLFKQHQQRQMPQQSSSPDDSLFSSGYCSSSNNNNSSIESTPASSLSSTPSTSMLSLNNVSSNQIKNESVNDDFIKSEPVTFTISSNAEFISNKQDTIMHGFSSDEEDDDEANKKKVKNQQQEFILKIEDENSNQQPDDNSNSNEGSSKNGVLTNQNNNPTLIILEQQLKQFTIKPFKLFTTIDDVTANNNNNASTSSSSTSTTFNNLENHLNLISSDDFRNKLMELNQKVKELNTASNQINGSKINQMTKEVFQFMYTDDETYNQISTSATDLAMSICLIFKNDFTNSLLPPLFYSNSSSSSSTTTNLTLNSSSKLFGNSNSNNSLNTIGLNENVDLMSRHLFSSNSQYLSLIGETITQRPIFILFKELSLSTNQSKTREVLFALLNEIYLKQNRIGYYFIYYIYYCYLKLQNTISNVLSSSGVISSTQQQQQSNEYLTLIKIYHDFIRERHQTSTSASFQNLKQTNSDNEGDNNVEMETNQTYEAISSSDPSSSSLSESGSDESDQDKEEERDDNDEENQDSNDKDEELDEFDLIIGSCLMQDLRLCQQDDSFLFFYLLAFLLNNNISNANTTGDGRSYVVKQSYFMNNSELIYLIVSCIDSKQLKDLLLNITSQDIMLFKQQEKDMNSHESSSKKKGGLSSALLKENSNNKKRKRNTDSKSKAKGDSKNNKKDKSSKKSKSKKLANKKNNLAHVLNASLYWETIEQIFFWEILLSHDDMNLSYLLPIFNRLDSNRNAEAVSYLFKLIKSSEPTQELVSTLLKRNCDDSMSKALFVNWTRNYGGESKLSQIFSKLINKAAVNRQKQTSIKKIKLNESSSFSSSSKKLTAEEQLELINNKKTSSNHAQNFNIISSNFLNENGSNGINDSINSIPTLDQILGHLNRLRLNDFCINFIMKEILLEALRKVYKKYLDDETKKKYSDLFTLVDEFIQSDSGGKGRKAKDNSDDENEEESDDMNQEEGDDDEEDEEKDDQDEEENEGKSSKNKQQKLKRKLSNNKKGSNSKAQSKYQKQISGSSSSSKQNKNTKSKNDNSSSEVSEDGDEGEEYTSSESSGSESSDFSSTKKSTKKSATSNKNQKKVKKSSSSNLQQLNKQPPRKKMKQQSNNDDGNFSE